ncbi:hypothetical protein MB02_05575 [Croceicoccus estronivorus]|nr:hypothetical protein MB02_05575 [Croceicoccus estronivorus]
MYVLLACGLAALLSACFITPGHFTSTLDIRKNGQFSFTYQGEIFMLAFSKLGEDKNDVFSPASCYDGDTGEERDCTATELAEQRKEWADGADERAAKRKREAEEMRAFLGGIDPSDPAAAEKFAAKLQRQAGWRRVTYKENGLFEVDFAVSGTLGYDFAFPTMEQVANTNPFVALSLREDGSVRVDAPAFGSSGADPLKLMAMGQGMSAANKGKDGPKFPEMAGTFTLTTDAAILANNTDEGPQADANGKKLEWNVSSRSSAPPMALIQMDR